MICSIGMEEATALADQGMCIDSVLQRSVPPPYVDTLTKSACSKAVAAIAEARTGKHADVST